MHDINADGIGCPANAPGQKQRVLDWLRTEPGGLTQLQALQHLAVARLAAIVWRLREDDGYAITTELVEMPTRYGPATVARYHLGQPERPERETPRRVPVATLQPRYAPAGSPSYIEQARPKSATVEEVERIRAELFGAAGS